jgi:serine protease AprX
LFQERKEKVQMNKWRKLIQVVLAGIMWVGLCGAVPAAAPAPLKAQALLLQMAAAQPSARLSVIVQKADKSDQVEELVASLGGRVTDDLHIINAFGAQVPGKSVAQLASAEGVRWVSLDAVMTSTACAQCVDTTKLANAYIGAIRADSVWNQSPYLQGQGIGVAVVDSGINPSGDLYTVMGVNRQVANVRFNTDYNQNASDGYGHGTHVSSIVGGDGSESNGQYIGVAPMVNIINVKVSNDDGSATAKDVVRGLQWVVDNKAAYNIRIVNLSLNSSVAESYQTSALDAAVEILWFNKIVVVVAAGNRGSGAIYPPANDPFVITVGATDDKGTRTIADDVVPSFSAYGTTTDGASKPDLVAPGKNIVARLVNSNMGLAQAHPANLVSGGYFRMSGTSMAAPMVSGAVALLLQDEPNLTPDQVKYRLMATANKDWGGYNASTAGAGYLDIYAAVSGTTTVSANQGVVPHQLLAKMALIAVWASQNGGESIDWNSVNWNSVNWNSVNWNSVNWNSVNWNSVNWNSVNWNSVNWNSVNWNSVNWNSVNWNSVNWNSVNWNSVNWNSVNWNSDYWGQ